MKNIRAYITLLFLFIASHIWAWNEIYLLGDHVGWDKQAINSLGTSGKNGKDAYIENGQFFAFYIDYYCAQAGPSDNSHEMSVGAGDARFATMFNSNAAKYTGEAGIVRFCVDQTNNHDADPWVWIERPAISLMVGERDIWLTDNYDGTYTGYVQYLNTTYSVYATFNGNKKLYRSSASVAAHPANYGTICTVTYNSKNNTLNFEEGVELGTNITLIANTSLLAPVTYTFSVQQPGESVPSVIYSGDHHCCDFGFTTPGTYYIYIQASSGAENEDLPLVVTIAQPRYQLSYSFEKQAHRQIVDMTYNELDNTYIYYQAVTTGSRYVSAYDATWHETGGDGDGYWAGITDDKGTTAWHKIINEENLADGTIVVFHYSPDRNKVWISNATTCYRIKSVCGDLGTFYSNTVFSANKAVSLFATPEATLSWQSSPTGLDGWTDVATIRPASITKNGIYTVTPTSLSQADLTFKEDSLPLSVNCGNVKDSVMVKFTSTTYYDHYLVKYLEKNTNIGAMVGNAINPCIANILPQYTLPQSANVRFEYKSETNKFTRTLLGGSTYDQFLHFYPTQGSISTSGDNPITESSPLKMKDASDWVYYSDVKVTTSTTEDVVATIYSHFNGTKRWILAPNGTATESEAKIKVIGQEATPQNYTFRVTYDFKTNRLICGWLPNAVNDVISGDKTINSNIIITREALSAGAGPSIFTFTNPEAHVTVNGNVIFELDIDKDDLFTSTPQGDKANLFQVTLPFAVNMTDIYGLDNYGQRWAIQDYKGELRALLGMRQPTGIADVDPIDDFWGSLIWTDNTKLLAGRGYVISHDFESTEFNAIESTAVKRLYFPSAKKNIVIRPAAQYADTTLREIHCSKPGREQYDSDWRVVGVPGFYEACANGTFDASGLQFFYEWAGAEGVYTIHSVKDKIWQPTKNYMIQYHGNINWSASLPSSVAARQAAPEEMYRLLLTSGEEMLDQAFVRLSADGTNDYVMGDDLLKIRSGRTPQIWTEMQGMALAANTLPDTTTSVILNAITHNSDEYTITLASGNHVHTVVLYDAVEQTYTDLSQLGSYTFTTASAATEGRFTLLFSPRIATDMEAATQRTPHQAIKMIENGHVVIWKDGIRFDALGKRL